MFNPITLISECCGPKIFGHIKHLLCCAVFLAIIVFGAPVFNAIIPIFSWILTLPYPASYIVLAAVILLIICCCACCCLFVKRKRRKLIAGVPTVAC